MSGLSINKGTIIRPCDVMCSKIWVGLLIKALNAFEAVIHALNMERCLSTHLTSCGILYHCYLIERVQYMSKNVVNV